jgi:hypothetical protein
VRFGAEEWNEVTRRTLLVILVAVVLVVALVFFIIRGRSSGSSATPTVTPAPTPNAVTQAKITADQAHKAYVAYARNLLPTLTQSEIWMSKTLAAASKAKDYQTRFNVCNADGGRVETYEATATSIPWPPSQTPSRSWRQSIFGTYHLFLGAIVECRNAYDTRDSGQMSLALKDLSAAAKQMTREVSIGQKVASGK